MPSSSYSRDASLSVAIGRLAELLADDDPTVAARAAEALAEVGPYVVGPLAAALRRAKPPRHRAAIIGALLTFGPPAPSRAGRALLAAARGDPDPRVRAAAEAALTALLLADERRCTGAGASRPNAAARGG
jgi:HEAT repeat protein